MADFTKLCDSIIDARKTVNEYSNQYKELYEKSKENENARNSVYFRDFLNGAFYCNKNNIDIETIRNYQIERILNINALAEAQKFKEGTVDVLFKIKLLSTAESLLNTSNLWPLGVTKTPEQMKYERLSSEIAGFMPGKAIFVGGKVKENALGEETVKPTHFFCVPPVSAQESEAVATHITIELKQSLEQILNRTNEQAKDLKGKIDELKALNDELEDRDSEALD